MNKNKLLEGLNYRQAQKRNSEKFSSFSKVKQKEIRQKGYKNIGWNNVSQSWDILQNFMSDSTLNFVNFAIKKAEINYEKVKENGDLLEILKSAKSVIKTLKIKYQ